MKKTIIGLALLFMTSGAYATGFSLAVDKQEVNILDELPAGTNNIGDVDVLSLPTTPAGVNSIGTVGLDAGANSVGTVGIDAGSNAIGSIEIVDTAGDELDVQADGSVNVNILPNVALSTSVIAGSNGAPIESTATAQGESLLTHDTSQPITAGLAMVMSSDDAVLVADATQVCTGLAKNVTLMAYGGSCTFTLWDASSMQITKNTGESFDLEFLVTNASIDLTVKDASATCKARITCAQ